VEVSVVDGFETIAAERHEEKTEGEQGKPGYRSEFRYGSFCRVISLPEGTKEDDLKATYADGILEVRAPVSNKPVTPNKIR
jgi:HSP20 family protein